MNRHLRRPNAVMARHNKFVADYVHHLPEVLPDTPLEPERVFHDMPDLPRAQSGTFSVSDGTHQGTT
jgi:hypothetical protein